MAIYSYSPDSLIEQIEIVTNDKGGSRAYLRARSDITTADVDRIQKSLTYKGWFGLPMRRGEQSVLELRGFHKPEELFQFLEAESLIGGASKVEKTKDDHQGFWDKFKSATLKWSGWTYILGDTAFLTYAGMEQFKHYQKSDLAKSIGPKAQEIAKANVRSGWYKILSGVGYGIGSLILANYGSRDQSHIEIQKSIKKIDRFLKAEGLAPADDDSVLMHEPEKKNKSFFGHVNSALRRFPSEALNLVYTGVGLSLMRSSLGQVRSATSEIKSAENMFKSVTAHKKPLPLTTKKVTDQLQSLKKHKGEEFLDIGLGSITAGSALAGILIKEKRPLEGQKPRKGFFEGTWDRIQEQPLRVTGIGYMIATGVHAVVTFMKWQPDNTEREALAALKKATGSEKIPKLDALKTLRGVGDGKISEKAIKSLDEFAFRRKTLSGRGVFIAANLLAEGLMILSSKGHGEGVRNADVDESVVASTAEYISRQNPATQEQLIQRLAGYMSAPDVLGMKAETIANDLRTQVAAMNTNPWARENGMPTAAVARELAEKQAAATIQQQALPTLHHGPSTKVQGAQRDGMIHEKQIAAAVQ